MSAHPSPRITPEQYLEIERAAQFRSEYYDGRIYAMSGGTVTHALLISNLVFALRSGLGKRPCLVMSSDMRMRVDPGGLYTYPDIVVVCEAPRFADNRQDTILNPVLMMEVFSPSTEAYDRGFKSAQYRTMSSLQEYALVAQSEARVEVFRRQLGGDWLLSESVGLEACCRLESIGCALPLSAVYGNVTFGGDEGNVAPPSAGS